MVDTATGTGPAGPETGSHDHAWHSLTAGSAATFSDYQCSLCGITWSL